MKVFGQPRYQNATKFANYEIKMLKNAILTKNIPQN